MAIAFDGPQEFVGGASSSGNSGGKVQIGRSEFPNTTVLQLVLK